MVFRVMLNDWFSADSRVGVAEGILKLLSGEELRQKEVRRGRSHKMMELFTTHRKRLKRIKYLSTPAV